MSIGKIRSGLYFTAKLLGDVNAVRKGRVKERLTNRALGKLTGFLLSWITKKQRKQ